MSDEEILARVIEESEGDPYDVLSHVVCPDVTCLYEAGLITDYEEDGDITCTFRLTGKGFSAWGDDQQPS